MNWLVRGQAADIRGERLALCVLPNSQARSDESIVSNRACMNDCRRDLLVLQNEMRSRMKLRRGTAIKQQKEK